MSATPPGSGGGDAVQALCDDGEPTLAETTAFARRHGLGGLAPEHLARMRELAAPVARFGRQVRRPPRKDDAPASEFRVTEPRWTS